YKAFSAKESPISSPDPITSPAILTPSLILSPSLLFDPRYFFVLEELLPPKKQIHSPSSSSTTLSNPSQNQTRNLVSFIFLSLYSYLTLDELHLHRIERMEEGRINGNKLKTKLKRIRTQIIRLQKKRLGQKDKIAFAHYRIGISAMVIENKVKTLTITTFLFQPSKSSVPLHSGTNNMIPPVFLSFYNNPCLKDVQAFYAKELPISSPDPITPPAILTPSPILPPSLLFDPRYFFVPEKLLPPKKRICSLSSSSTTLSNSSRNQTYDLISPSSSVYTPTPPQIFEIGKCSVKMHLKHHEKQVEDILNYITLSSPHRENGGRTY
ncbi:hypothetical protein Tco_1187298, partial [Tanacetum coccineum]